MDAARRLAGAAARRWPSGWARRRSRRRATGRRTVDDAADRDRPGEDQGRGAGRAGALEGPAPRRRAATWSRPTCWSTACAGAARSGTGSGSTCSTSPRRERPEQEPLEVDYDPWSGPDPDDGPARCRPPCRAALAGRSSRSAPARPGTAARRGPGREPGRADRRPAARPAGPAAGDRRTHPPCPPARPGRVRRRRASTTGRTAGTRRTRAARCPSRSRWRPPAGPAGRPTPGRSAEGPAAHRGTC